MKLRSQILLAQAPATLIMLLVVALFVLVMTSIEYQTQSILSNNVDCILSIEKLNESIEELNDYTIHHPKSFDGETKKMENKVEQALELELLLKEKSTSETSEEKELTQSLRKKWESYKASLHALSPSSKIEKRYKELKQIMDNIIGLNQDVIIRKKDKLINFIIDYRLFIFFISIFSLIFGFFISWVFTGLFLMPLNKMSEIVSQFGKTDKRILLHIKGSEELEKLSEEFNLMTSRLEEYHQSSLGHAIEDYENLKGAFDAPPYPVLVFSHNNEIIFMNTSALRLFGVIQSKYEKKYQIFYIENSLRESLLKIVKQVQLTRKPYVPEKAEKLIAVFRKKKKNLFIPFAYPIKNNTNGHTVKSMSVLMILQDVRLRSASELEAELIVRHFIQDIQAPLAEIQLAIHTSLQEEIGPLTEEQKDILYAARNRSEELEKLYQDFFEISEIHKKEG